MSKSQFDLEGSSTQGYERLRDIALSLGVQGGKHVASVMDRALTYRIRKIPTGIFMLDWYTHGGIPLDRITRIYGKKDSCKTTTMLKIMANAQRYCRYCKGPIVVDPKTGKRNCACPRPRYRLTNPEVLEFVSYEAALAAIHGKLPKGSKKGKGDEHVWGKGGKQMVFEETYRCAPFQTLLVETEHKLDQEWARLNGVDPGLVVVIGGDWAESVIDTLEKLLYSGEVDIVFIDTLSMFTPAEEISKSMEDNPRVAGKARQLQRCFQKIVAAQYANGLISNNEMTFVCNSQVRTKGIGAYRTWLGPSDGNSVEHLVTLDLSFRAKGYEWIHNEYASFGIYEFTVLKNHAGGSSGVSGNFKMWLDPKGPYNVGDTDDCDQTIKFGRKLDMIKGGTGKYIFESPYTSSGEYTMKTLGDLREFLVENPTVYLDLRDRVLAGLFEIRTTKNKKGKKVADSDDEE